MTRKLAAVQMVSGPDVERNLATAAELIAEAAAQGADLVLLPEVFAALEGEPMRAHGERQGAPGSPIQEFLSGEALRHGVVLIGGTAPLSSRPEKSESDAGYLIEDGRVRASSLVYDAAGELLARYDKIHLFDVMIEDRQAQYSESLSYEAGSEVVCVDTEAGRLGLSVCYDLRFPELYRRLFRLGAEILTVPAAFTAVTGEAHWESLLRARAIENQCYLVAAAQGGSHGYPRETSRETWGHSMIVSPWGEILAELDKGPGVAVAEMDLLTLRDIRRKMPVADHIRLG
ncbi:MAG: carbon-nitrogen hydrolase family protein [Gammaproteobacteria bacterium]|nr:carbon-nitrogen hydrolase family protein [Gammaproteobacteria bacterium]MCY3688281.1 carbon-nitrogen hydrolase family protein [Gammaproteobacteria bacterium]MDE0479643.1 carbon-nitrogen hydrolase family protein [Gammaproteobacteria bacterium]MDE0507833.1 carbon-nitrogen hydrolase family protein [Gammaproteobacteria bacterium]MXY90507.1 carbon-nitrogen hydrolase family protein [Gammaproteobacteria bacterium]